MSVTKLRVMPGAPKILLSDALYAQDPQTFIKNPDIRLVINTSVDSPASSAMKKFYVANGIDYLYAPLADIDMPPPPDFLPKIVKFVKKHDSDTILIHCSAGVNRSALLAAAILWYTTPNRQLYWSTPKELIEYMRTRQISDRKYPLLINDTFYNYLLKNLK
jgi:hypothetical protein